MSHGGDMTESGEARCKKDCKFRERCYDVTCKKRHPPGWDPRENMSRRKAGCKPEGVTSTPPAKPSGPEISAARTSRSKKRGPKGQGLEGGVNLTVDSTQQVLGGGQHAAQPQGAVQQGQGGAQQGQGRAQQNGGGAQQGQGRAQQNGGGAQQGLGRTWREQQQQQQLVGLRSPEAGTTLQTKDNLCWFKMDCKNPNCKYDHPEGWHVAGAQQLTYVTSESLGPALYPKLVDMYGDPEDLSKPLKKLRFKDSYDVIYTEKDGCLKALVSSYEAARAKKLLDGMVQAAREIAAKDSELISLVGRTRVSVGRGGGLRGLLMGRECTALKATGVRCIRGGSWEDTVKALRQEMLKYGEVSVWDMDFGTTDPKRQKEHRMMALFESSEEAAAALESLRERAALERSFPWGTIWPAYREPRENTMLLEFGVKIKYPTSEKAWANESFLQIHRLVAQFGAKMHDIELLVSKEEKVFAAATARLPSLSQAQEAARYLDGLTSTRLSPNGPLRAKPLVHFCTRLSRDKFFALWPLLCNEKKRLEAQFRNISIKIKPPPHPDKQGRKPVHADIMVGPSSQDLFDQVKGDMKAACKRLEELFKGQMVMDLPRQEMHKMPGMSPYNWANLEKMLPEFKKELPSASKGEPFFTCVTPILERENGRLRLFGSDRADVREASDCVKGLLMSLEASQPQEIQISPAATSYINRGGEGSREQVLAQLQRDSGVGSCVLARGGGAIEAKGTAAALAKLRVAAGWLEREAEAGRANHYGGGSVMGHSCPICLGPADPEALYIMEPCGHAYCSPCAQQHVQNAINNGRLPIKCAVLECNHLVSLEDVKQCMETAEGFARAVRIASQQYVNSNATRLGRCMTDGCPQVFRKGRGPKFECDYCLETYCTDCCMKWHEGKTCEQVQAMLLDNIASEAWVRDNTRPCPNCRAPFFKGEGCNRLRCTACRKCFCNICADMDSCFDTENEVYAHLIQKHKGYFT